jgi:hypothetical protein
MSAKYFSSISIGIPYFEGEKIILIKILKLNNSFKNENAPLVHLPGLPTDHPPGQKRSFCWYC